HCIIHLHTTDGVAVLAQADGPLPLDQHAMLIAGDIAYHDYEGVALDLDERERLLKDIRGGKHRSDLPQPRHPGGWTDLCGCLSAHVLRRARLLDAGASARRRGKAQLAEPGRTREDPRAGCDRV